MKKYIKNRFYAGFGLLAISMMILFSGCGKEEVLSLGAVTKADFTATIASDGYNVTVVNSSGGKGMAYFAAPSLNLGYGDLKGDTARLSFTFPGTYQIKMLYVSQGGLDSITKTITTTKANPTACNPTTALGFIASCTEKKWKLNPQPAALWVSQFAGGEGNWWQNSADDVTARSCVFNDEYIFKFNAAGDFIFDDKGDFYAEDYTGDPQWSCRASSTYPAAQKPWGSGNFKYVVFNTGGVKNLGQLKVIGLGAHIGLQKPINDNETPGGATATSITYDIWDKKTVTDATGTYDLLTLTFHYGSWSATEGWWTFTLRSY